MAWARCAAEQGDGLALARMGDLYCMGWGVPRDAAEGVRYYRLALEKGHAHASLGYCYEQGYGVSPDLSEAARLYRAAAEQDDSMMGMCHLGRMLEKGQGGLARDPSEAARLYAAAARSNQLELAELLAYTKWCFGRADAQKFDLACGVYFTAIARRIGDASAEQALAELARRCDVAASCCMGCGAMRQLSWCEGCRVARFCGSACQKEVWLVHKAYCREWKRAAEDGAS